MNYIAEINSFYNWVMMNPVPPDAQALWHVLMQMNNRCAVKLGDVWYWRVEFSVPNSTLLSILIFSRQQLDRMRNVLIQSGRIVYQKGKRGQSGIYQMIPFNTQVFCDADFYPEKLWLPDCANNVTSLEANTPKKPYYANNVTNPDTSPDTNPDTNSGQIHGTQIKYNNNYIYKHNSFCGDDGLCAPACAEALSDFLPELNAFDGMTEEVKREVSDFSCFLFAKYFGREPSMADMMFVFNKCRKLDGLRFKFMDREKKELLEYAFEKASNMGHSNLPYVEGILKNLNKRNLLTREACELYDSERVDDKYDVAINQVGI